MWNVGYKYYHSTVFKITLSSIRHWVYHVLLKFQYLLWLIARARYLVSRSQGPRGLRRRSLAVRLLRLWVRIPPRAWMFVCCECCVLSGRGLCDGLTTRPEKSYRLWCVAVCDQETS